MLPQGREAARYAVVSASRVDFRVLISDSRGSLRMMSSTVRGLGMAKLLSR
jgi:hypothetical protein